MKLIEAIGAVAEERPQCVAVEEPGRRLTYSELLGLAQDHSLGLLGQGHSWQLVCGERSSDFVARLLGTWMAGRVPLILDRSVPSERLGQLELTLSRERLEDDVEYLCSTSGSSGQPKIVKVGSGSLHAMANQQRVAFGLGPESRFFWMLSPGFDASLSDIATTLLSGACLVCGRDWENNLPELLANHKISHVDIPPSVLRLYKPEEFPQGLDTIVLGGETSDPEKLRAWSHRYRMIAVYGPTEATVCTSLSEVDEGWTRAFIGQPLEGVSYRVEDGELCIGGPQVALGYVGELSSPEFFQRDGSRWYRTGDLVGPADPKHGYEFLGRRDRQVKVRGQRIELGEIEYYAGMIADPSAVAVVLCDERIVLFWEHRPGLHERNLREGLERFLPVAFCPQQYVGVEKLPRHPSSKIDYATLEGWLGELPLSEMNSLERLDHFIKLERESVGKRTEALRFEVADLCESVTSRGGSLTAEVHSVLLTGSTGRLGRILEPMLSQHFTVWKLNRRPCDSHTLVGNLEEPLLGLSQEHWDFLQAEVDLVVNLAGSLDLNHSFEELRGVNLDSVVQLLELEKPLVQASTLATTLCAEPPDLEREPDKIFGGYAQTKWTVEQLLGKLDWPGLDLRYGQLLGWPDDRELLSLVIRGLLDLEAYPLEEEPGRWYFDLTPTEWAASQTLERMRSFLSVSRSRRASSIVRRGWAVHFADLVGLLKVRELPLQAKSLGEFRALPALTKAAQVAQLAFSHHKQWSLFLLGNLDEEWKTSEGALNLLEVYLDRLLTSLSDSVESEFGIS